MSKKVTIIGSGISSLTTAIILLQKGYEVRILEQHYVAGGYLHTFKRFGVEYETGGHYQGALGDGLPFQRLLSYLGVFHEDDYIELDRDHVDVYRFEGWGFSYGTGYEKNILNLIKIFPDLEEKIKKFFDRVSESAHCFPTYYFKTEIDQKLVMKHLNISLSEVFDELEIEGRLREVLEAPCLLHGVSPKDVSFGVHSIMTDSLIVSAHGFKNGGKQLVKRFTDKIVELGGEILLRKKVTSIERDGKRIKAVTCESGESFESDLFISGIHPKLIFEMIGHENLRKSFSSRLTKIRESDPFVGAYLLLKDSVGINAKSNYYFYPKGTQSVFGVELGQKRGPFVFMSSPLRTYNGEGELPLSLHAPCQSDEFKRFEKLEKRSKDEEYLKLKEELFKPLIETIEEEFPGFKKSIVSICYSSPLTNQFYNPSPNGSAYGIYHDSTCTGVKSLGPRTHFENLYLTGQNTLFPGLLGASVSGLRTSGHIVGIKSILNQLKN